MSKSFTLLIAFTASQVLAQATHTDWNRQADCVEYTPNWVPIRTLDKNICRAAHGSQATWDRNGNCFEYTPTWTRIQPLDPDYCRTTDGTVTTWDRYGKCVEYTPGWARIQIVDESVCKTVGEKLIKKSGPILPGKGGSKLNSTSSGPDQNFPGQPSVDLKTLKGDPYAWAPHVSGPAKPSSGSGLSNSLQNASKELLSVYKSALSSLAVVRPVAEEGEDRNKVVLLENTLKVASSTLEGQSLPVTHWRVRENARMILVMSEIVVSVFGEVADIKHTKDPDSKQRSAVQDFAQAMMRVQVIIGGLRETFGLKGFVGEASRATNPLAKIFQLQLLQLKATLGAHRDAGDSAPRFEQTISALEQQISRIKDLNGKGDASRLLKAEIRNLADLWNTSGPGSAQELIQRALSMGSTTAADAELLYVAAASLGNIHKQITFKLPSVPLGTQKK